MATPITMPKQGQSVESCVLLEWLKKKGDSVKQGEVVFTYETDKASFEFCSPASGALLETFFDAQDDVPVHAIVAVIGEPGENPEQFRPKRTPVSEKSPDRTIVAAGAPTDFPAPHQGPFASKGPAPASPRARRKASERRLDLTGVSGSGPGGRIIERDILSLPAACAAAHDTSESGKGLLPDAEDTVTEVALSTIRKIIGSRMQQSLLQSAQLTMNAFADATALLELRKRFKSQNKDCTITDIVAMATARTLLKHPDLNALYKDEKILRYARVHLAMAVDTPRGLMVPVVRLADRLSLEDLSRKIKELSSQCREGSINPDLLTGGTITISNLGALGVESFTPILNAPQVAIVGVNAIMPRIVQTQGSGMAIRPHLGFSLTIDHRVVDGAPGARFLKELCETIAIIDKMVTQWA